MFPSRAQGADRLKILSVALTDSSRCEGLEATVERVLSDDAETFGHSIHAYALAGDWIGANLFLSPADAERLLQATLLHDVGKILIPQTILLAPRALTEEEMRTVQRHAKFGERLLEQSEPYRHIARIVGQHHEWWNGRGYPDGLGGEQIEPLARALSIIDAYSAMILDRPYHRGITEDEALEELELCAGSQFDRELVRRFVLYRRSRIAA